MQKEILLSAKEKLNERKYVALNCTFLFYENTHSLESWSLSLYIFSDFTDNIRSYLCSQMKMAYIYTKKPHKNKTYIWLRVKLCI